MGSSPTTPTKFLSSTLRRGTNFESLLPHHNIMDTNYHLDAVTDIHKAYSDLYRNIQDLDSILFLLDAADLVPRQVARLADIINNMQDTAERLEKTSAALSYGFLVESQQRSLDTALMTLRLAEAFLPSEATP